MTLLQALLRLVLWWVLAVLAAAGIAAGWLWWQHIPITGKGLATPIAIVGVLYGSTVLVAMHGNGADAIDNPFRPWEQTRSLLQQDRQGRGKFDLFGVGAAVLCFLLSWLLCL